MYKSYKLKMGILLFLCLLIVIFCMGIGRYNYEILKPITTLWSLANNGKEAIDDRLYIVFFNIRLPRIILALLAGASLSVAGVAFQSLFANPLATPDTLGVASGASFGAVLGILFNFNAFSIQILALIFGIIALAVTYLVCSLKQSQDKIMIILAGIVVSSLFSALVSLCKYLADAEEVLPTITFWLLGSLSSANYKAILIALPFMLVGIAILVILRWRLNILSLSRDEAKSLGINIKYFQIIVMLAATMVTASTVSVTGQLGWIGLLVPHICRMIFGSNNYFVVPASLVIGASLLVVIDTAARSVSYAEIPVSILTALIGAPLFIFLLVKTGGLKL